MYKRFYGFKKKPFEITPDPSYVYLSEVHREGLSYLEYAIRERKGFSVITGEAGTGKTTLAHKLLSNLDGNVRTCYIFNPMIEKADFLNYICSDLGIPTENLKTRGQSLTALHNFLLNCFTKNEKVFLIVDEAQSLAHDLLHEVRMLTNLETAKYKLIHVILLGQPEFDDILAKPEFFPLKQRITVRYHLHPLPYKETKEYILYRLKRAGARNLAIFNESAIKEIFNYSKGIPRLINIVCDNALLTGFATEQGRINKEIVQNVINDLESGARSHQRKKQYRLPFIILLVFVIAVVIAIFFWYILN